MLCETEKSMQLCKDQMGFENVAFVYFSYIKNWEYNEHLTT